MYAIVHEGRQRRQRGELYTGRDAWRDDIPPHTATRARTVPVLEEERDRLRTALVEVCYHCMSDIYTLLLTLFF
jgi:hypothetical protein